MRTHLLIAASLTLVLAAGCKKTPNATPATGSGSGSAPPPTTTGSAATPATGSGSAVAPAAATGSAATTGAAAAGAAIAIDPAAKAAADKISAAALELCGKEIDAVKSSERKANDKLVGVIGFPQDPGFNSAKDGVYPWLATRAGVVQSDDVTIISIVNDDTDPCAIKAFADLLTSKGNPAAQIRIDGAVATGEHMGWHPTPGQTQISISFGGTKGPGGKYSTAAWDGPALTNVTKFDPGKSIELDIHACHAQKAALMGAPPHEFVIGHVVAAFCPK